MFEYLLSYSLSCTDAKAIIARAKSIDMDANVVTEVVETIKDSVYGECDWDAND
tara:strand:+ start:275 stop:436 length:162 start_codon:yes stop_codon:yes gene_type:complete